jgi:hypothetical protein
MREMFQIDASVETRLWVFKKPWEGWYDSRFVWYNSPYMSQLLTCRDKSLQDAGIKDGNSIIIERKTANGWTMLVSGTSLKLVLLPRNGEVWLIQS